MKKIFKQALFCIAVMMGLVVNPQVANAQLTYAYETKDIEAEGIDIYTGVDYFHEGDYYSAILSLSPYAEDGDDVAQYILGLSYASIAEENAENAEYANDAIYWLTESAKNENPYAYLSIGRIFIDGEIIDQDCELGFKCVDVAANMGLVEAQYILGLLYEDGIGTPRDHEVAIDWLLEADNNGHPDALDALVSILE